jgi:uncharacterized membrane protein
MSRPAFKTASESFPKSGNRELPYTLDFTNIGTITDDLSPEMEESRIETIQSVFVDNSANAASFILQFFPSMQIVYVQPYMQGVFPIICWGRISYKATTAQGIKIPVIFSNTAKPFMVWGPTPGVNIVPPLTNLNYNVAPLVAGDNQLVAAVANETVKFYRGIFTVGAATILTFYDGPSAGNLPLFTAYLTTGGSIAFQPSGIPWFTNSAGNALVLNSTEAVNCYGGFGYVQS